MDCMNSINKHKMNPKHLFTEAGNITPHTNNDKVPPLVDVKQGNNSESSDALLKNESTISSVIKLEEEWEDYEIEYIPRSTFMDVGSQQEPKPQGSQFQLEKLRVGSSDIQQEYNKQIKEHNPNTTRPQLTFRLERYNIIETDKNEPILDLERFKEKDADQKLPFIKIESSQATDNFEQENDIVFEEWKVKNEELVLKDEDFVPDKMSMSSNSVCESEQQMAHKCEHDVNTDKFKCDQCDHQALLSSDLNKQQSRHKDPDKVAWLKCDQCDYQTVIKNSLKTHVVRNHRFQCDQCDYQTVDQNCLNTHVLRHKDPEEFRWLKCDECDYQALFKRSLEIHLLRHRNNEEVKCTQCDYQTINKISLRRHISRHKKSQVNVLKCVQCNYKTVRKDILKLHLLRHRNPKEFNTFKCYRCDYQTINKSDFKQHLFRHIK